MNGNGTGRARRNRRAVMRSVAASVVGLAPVVRGDTLDWITANNTTGANFNTTANWDNISGGGDRVPIAGDTAQFNLNAEYFVNVNTSPTNTALTVLQGTVKMRTDTIASRTYTLSSATISGGSLTLGLPASGANTLALSLSGTMTLSGGNLVMNSGNDLTAAALDIGLAGGGVLSSATFSGAGTSVTTMATNNLRLGQGGNQGSVIFDDGAVANFAGGLSMTNSAQAASGSTVTVQGGSQVTFAGNVSLAPQGIAGQTTTLTVTGSGSQFHQNGSGTLSVGAAGAGTATLTVSDSATFTSGSGAISLNATGTMNLTTGGTFIANGDMTMGGGALNLSGGTLQIGSGVTTGSLSGNVTNNGTIIFNRSDTSIYGGEIGGSGAVIKNGGGLLTFSGINTYSGGTTINAGALRIGADNQLGTGGGITFNGGTLNTFNNFSTTRAITLGAGGGTFDVDTTWTLSLSTTPITGSGMLIKSGGGFLNLGAASSYTGKTSIIAGTLRIDISDNRLGIAPSGGAVADQLQISNGATLSVTNTMTMNANRGITLGAGGGVIGVGTGAFTYNGIIAGTSLSKSGNGTLTLGGANTFSGGMTLTMGRVNFNADGSAGTGTITVTPSSTVTLATTATSATLPNDIVLNPGSAATTISAGTGDTLILNGVISGTETWTLSGAGNVVFGGGSPNTFAIPISVSSGTLTAAKNGALGTVAGGTTVNSGGALGFQGDIDYSTLEPVSIAGHGVGGAGGAVKNISGTNTFAGAVTMTADSSIGSDAGSLLLNGVISGNFNLSKVGSGDITLGSANSFTGEVRFNGGSLSVSNLNRLGPSSNPLIFNGGLLGTTATMTIPSSRALTFNALGGGFSVAASTSLTVSNPTIIGSGSLTKRGPGTMFLDLPSSNTYTGTIVVNEGAVYVNLGSPMLVPLGNMTVGDGIGGIDADSLSIYSNVQLPPSAGPVTVNSSGLLWFAGFDNFINDLVLAGGHVHLQPTIQGTFLVLNGNVTTLASNSTAKLTGQGTLEIGGGIINVADGPAVIDLDVDENYGGTVTKTGGGAMRTQIGSNSPFTLSEGSLLLGSTFNGSFGTLGFDPLILAGGILSPSLVPQQLVGTDIELTGAATIDTAGLELFIDGSSDFNITGSGSLTKTGAGTLKLSGTANTYAGTTTITAGTLQAVRPGSLSGYNIPGKVSVASGATLAVNVNGFEEWKATDIDALRANVALPPGSTLAIDTSDGTVSFPFTYGNISGSFGLTKLGANMLVLSGANTYAGVTTVSAGTLSALSPAALPGYNVSGQVSVAGGATLAIRAGGGGSWVSADIDALCANASFASGSALGIDTSGGSFTYGNVIPGAGVGLTKLGANTLILTGANTYTGTTTAAEGVLRLDFSAAAAPATNVSSSSSALRLAGGQLALVGKASVSNSQTFASTTVDPGASSVTLTAATSNPLLLGLGTITRNVGGTVELTLPSGTQSASNGVTTTNALSNGILGGAITVGKTNWAAKSGNNIVALSSYVTNTWAAGNNTTVTTHNAPPSGSTTNSLRFNTSAATSATLTGTNTITSGGILVTPAVGNAASGIFGGTLRGEAGADLVIHQHNTLNPLRITSTIVDNSTATGLTKSGAGTLELEGSLAYTGPTTVNDGKLVLETNLIASSAVVVNGGTVELASGGAQSRVIDTPALVVVEGGQIDLRDNKLIVHQEGFFIPHPEGAIGGWNGSEYTGVTGLIDSGRGNGTWNGDGIVTSMSDATTSVLTTLAVALAQDVGYFGGTEFAGQSVKVGDVLVMYTWGGDAELDGDLDGDDYFWIDSNVGQSGSVFGFHFGDFDYDGDIDGDDYFIIDSNIAFAQTQPPFPTSSGGPASAGMSTVPEPASIGMLFLLGSMMLRSRR